MEIGVPKEIKNREHRVALTPAGVAALCARGHRVLVETGAGEESGYPDREYRRAGACIVPEAAQAWAAELVVKVKEPQGCEFAFLRPGLTLFTYLHLAAAPELARVLCRREVCAIGYETVQLKDGRLPLLAPMSRIAGHVAVQMALHYLQLENGTACRGRGVLAGNIEGVEPLNVLVLGAGNAGCSAARVAAALGCAVRLCDVNRQTVARLSCDPGLRHAIVEPFDASRLPQWLEGCDMLIGAALIPGARAPKVLQGALLERMHPRAVFVDIAIDQGGMSDSSRPTSYADPVYVAHEVIHCCLPNLPSCVARSSTQALTRATLPYVCRIADRGARDAMADDPALRAGLNVAEGHVVHPAVAEALAQ
ncbi:MAG: alanine dehydrogenase [Zetaproteobacteria bacterium]|nr:MAG: alanine dehydrogenase [Zetaproteobacteria bacterium]